VEGDGNNLLEAEHERDEEAKEEAARHHHHHHGSSLLGAISGTLHIPHMPWVGKPHHAHESTTSPLAHQADFKRRASVHHDALFDSSAHSAYDEESNDLNGSGTAGDLWKLISAHFDDIEAQVRIIFG